MCTVTVLPLATGGLRLAANRDEQRHRPAALPPEVRRFGERSALLPIDPDSDGTWVAVNDRGLALALLNVNPPERPRPAFPRRSRGTIIPGLLHHATLAEAVAAAQDLDPTAFPPFRLVLAESGAAAAVRADGHHLRVERQGPLVEPWFFTSSGLGDHLVEGPRRELFGTAFSTAEAWPAEQDAFHRHSWPDRPELSVCMRRASAHTVSLTVVTVEIGRVRLTYHPGAPDEGSAAITEALPGL